MARKADDRQLRLSIESLMEATAIALAARDRQLRKVRDEYAELQRREAEVRRLQDVTRSLESVA